MSMVVNSIVEQGEVRRRTPERTLLISAYKLVPHILATHILF